MYLSHFRLERAPFRNTPDPLFFFAGEGNREAMAGLLEGVLEGRGTILITGDVGTGKTTLAQALKASLIDSHIVVEISNPWSSHEEILEAIRHAILITETAATDTPLREAEIIAALRDRLIELDHIGRRVVLVIDEAHLLPSSTLEGLAQIAGIATAERQLPPCWARERRRRYLGDPAHQGCPELHHGRSAPRTCPDALRFPGRSQGVF